MAEDRLVDIETKLAFQEDTLQALNQVLCRQQKQMDRLERMMSALLGRIQDLAAAKERLKVSEEKPPHY